VSEALPNCDVCLSPWIKDVDRMLSHGASLRAIARSLTGRRSQAIYRKAIVAEAVPTISVSQVSAHWRVCVGGAPPDYVAAGDIPTPGGPQPILVSAAELADPARRLGLLREALAAKLGMLSADKIYAMYMAELKLQTAQTEREAREIKAAPDVPVPNDALDDAMAQAAGHLPDLRIVDGGRGKVASR
jgi:hypothetical protein